MSLSKNNCTVLKDRTLWYDGDETYTVKQLYDFILEGNTLNENVKVVDKSEEDIKKFNMLSDFRLTEKEDSDFLPDTSWNISQKYKNLELRKFFLKKLLSDCEKYDISDVESRISRVDKELTLWEEYGVTQLLRTCIYIVDTFKENGIVWGTGRGSGCASYLLYLMELHDVDSVEYDIDIREFFR